MKALFLTTAAAGALLATPSARAQALATGAGTACPHYAGHVDVEGRYGSKRHLGTLDLFIPVACSPDALLFADIRTVVDNKSNREGNVGLGIRHMHGTGILGVYGFFDRRRSGETDKLHSQITLGTEWLAEDWEIRGNAYIPTTGEKRILTSSTATPGSGPLAPFLADTGLYYSTGGPGGASQSFLIEKPLYGIDAEVGVRLPVNLSPIKDTWIYGGGYHFDAGGVDNVTGGRIRTQINLTDHIQLHAEGQYDGPRGRAGSVALRLRLPFGGPADKPSGLAARMTNRVERDIDIVTQGRSTTVVTGDPGTLIPVLNAETGAEQRVLHVDNTAAAGGDGSKDNPFNTLAAAQAAMQAHDVVYVHYGDGTTTGQDQGFHITQEGVMLIGSGVDFVYDGAAFTAGGEDFTGTVIAPATQNPVLTNTNAGIINGDGIRVEADKATIAGLTVDGASQYGIRSWALSGATWENFTVHDVIVSNNSSYGVGIGAQLNSNIDVILLDNLTATSNSNVGISIHPGQNANINTIYLNNITSTGNPGGISFSSDTGSTTNMISMSNTTVVDNGVAGMGIAGVGDLIAVDLGGGAGGSAGNNRLYDQSVYDLRASGNVAVSAQHNWWGQAGGPQAGQVQEVGAATVDTSNWLDADPDAP